MNPRRTMLHFAIWGLMAGAAQAQTGAVSAASPEASAALDQALAANRLRFEATVKADATALDRLLGVELTYCHSSGKCDDKRAYVESLVSGKTRYKVFESVENKPRLYGDFVVINGRAHVTVNLDGKEQTFDLSYTDVFVKRDGRFQMIAWQSTRLPDAAPATRTEDTARSTVLARFDASLHGDVAALDRLLADDLAYCTFRGDCETKAQYLGEVKSGRLKYVSIAPTVSSVKLFADSAVVLGLATVTAVRDGIEHTIHISWAGVLAWRDARWQMTTWTSTLLEAPAK